MTALYALTLREDASGRDLGSVGLRWTEPDASRESRLDRPIRADDLADRFDDTPPTFRLDAIVAATAEALRRTEASGDTDLRDVRREALRIESDLPGTDQVHDFLEFLDRAAELGG